MSLSRMCQKCGLTFGAHSSAVVGSPAHGHVFEGPRRELVAAVDATAQDIYCRRSEGFTPGTKLGDEARRAFEISEAFFEFLAEINGLG